MNTERPILFSTAMVQAILEGRKTMTRRLKGLDEINENPNKYKAYDHICRSSSGKQFAMGFLNKATKENTIVNVPYGYIGDVLYVRETFQSGYADLNFIYKADCDNPLYSETKWKPSLFMPKEAARIWLEITDVRVERLQDISEEDAIKEGVDHDFTIVDGVSYVDYTAKHPSGKMVARFAHSVNSFRSLWESINGKYSWNKNPFVWCVSFKRIEK